MNENTSVTYSDFERLFREKHYSLERIAYYLTGNDEEAKDIVGKCFMNLWEHKDEVSADNALSYMFISIRNACLDYRRHDTVHRKVFEEIEKQEKSAMDFYTSTIESRDPSSLLNNEISHIINNTIKSLPEEQRRTYILTRIEGQTYKKAAVRLGISVKKVDKNLQSVTRKLRTALKEYLPVLVAVLLTNN